MSNSIRYTFGIGDIIILKEYCLTTNTHFDKLIIGSWLLKYRQDNNYILFFEKLAKKLMGDDFEVMVDDKTELFNVSIIRNNFEVKYLYDMYNFSNYTENYEQPYIILHTRCRLSTDESTNFFLSENTQQLLSTFFSNFKTSNNIILMGERDIEDSFETKYFGFQSVYKLYLNLFTNNNVIDLTSNSLGSSNTIENFEKELHIINKAKLNITFGEGGNFVICNSFSKNNICYIGLSNCVGAMPIQYEKLGTRDLNFFLSEIIRLV